MRTDDPFRSIPEPVYTTTPNADTPITVYAAPDGALRLFANDVTHPLPDRGGRNPLYTWDIAPDSWAPQCRHTVFDTFDAGLPLRPECDPGVDMCKLLPHPGGRGQYLVYRVRVVALTIPYLKAVVTPEEIAVIGVYHSKITYAEEHEPRWRFGGHPDERI